MTQRRPAAPSVPLCLDSPSPRSPRQMHCAYFNFLPVFCARWALGGDLGGSFGECGRSAVQAGGGGRPALPQPCPLAPPKSKAADADVMVAATPQAAALSVPGPSSPAPSLLESRHSISAGAWRREDPGASPVLLPCALQPVCHQVPLVTWINRLCS